MENITINEIKEFSAEDLFTINELIVKLGSINNPLNEEDYRKILSDSGSHLFFIYMNQQIAGMLTLGSYRTPTGLKFWVEDVVVDDKFRGLSLGRKLVEHAIAFTSVYSNCQLMLTSNPSRVAANKLYQSVGFNPKQTNVYRISFPLEIDK